MARIRSIKPEFWTSEQVVSVSPLARLLFIGLWNFADDQGVHPANAKRISMAVFPGDKFADKKIKELLKELLGSRLLTIFEDSGKPYFFITGWNHQKIAKKTAKYPAPPEEVLEQCATSTVPVQYQYPPDVDVYVDVDVDVEKKGAVSRKKKKSGPLTLDPASLDLPTHLRTTKFKKHLAQWIDWKQSQAHAWKHQNGPSMFINRLAEFTAEEADPTVAAELKRSSLYDQTLGPIRKQISQAETPEEKEELQQKLKTAREKLEQKLAAQGVA